MTIVGDKTLLVNLTEVKSHSGEYTVLDRISNQEKRILQDVLAERLKYKKIDLIARDKTK